MANKVIQEVYVRSSADQGGVRRDGHERGKQEDLRGKSKQRGKGERKRKAKQLTRA